MNLFKKFKEITQEETKIIEIIKNNVKVADSTKVLDVGSNEGNISKAIQDKKDKITLVDINEFDLESGIRFIKSGWENLELKEKFDLILASHVWGHFGYTNTQKIAFERVLFSKDQNGKIVLCYNTNSGFMGELIKFSKEIIKDFQYDYFDEDLIKEYNKKEILFNVVLKGKDFEELVELIQILIITEPSHYKGKKQEMKKFLEINLDSPSFLIEQKIVII